MASAKVFNTYELLENTTAYLPAVDVTVVMRVSKAWHEVIERSNTLHDARILAPIGKISP